MYTTNRWLWMRALLAAWCCVAGVVAPQTTGEATGMEALTIRWWGQACFTISDGRTTVLNDPFPADFGYQPPDVPASVVTVSHEHRDHNAVEVVAGQPAVLRGPGRHEAGGLVFTGVASAHDGEQGAKRGSNTIFVWQMGGLRLAHLGDLGHVLTEEQVAAVGGAVDVLMIPVGGYYTIDAAQAAQVIEQLGARLVVPMHVKTAALERLPIATVDAFVQTAEARGWTVRRHPQVTLTLKPEDLPPAGRQVVVLPYE